MDRASQNVRDSDPGTEVSREEKEQIASSAGRMEPQPIDPIDEREISRNQLINTLNHINFQDLTISVVFKHIQYPRTLTLNARPLPCHDMNLTCDWVDTVDTDALIESYRFECLRIAKEQQLLEVVPEIKNIGERQIGFSLPTTCREISERKIHRYQCRNIAVFLFQNGALFYGQLVDYYAFQFRVQVYTTPPQTFRWIDSKEPVSVVFSKGADTLFSGDCAIVKHDNGHDVRHIILEPVHRNIHRFRPVEYRSTRIKLTPSPDVSLEHPLLDKTFRYKIHDISGSGFSVEEEERLAVLLPGMIIPRLEIQLSDGSSVPCMAQVLYSNAQEQRRGTTILRCGLAILDMAPNDHVSMVSMLYQAGDANAYICNKVDMEALWAFFFDTGFIYPKKYEHIQLNKEKIKKTYEKLYLASPSIATHFIHQENGRILAHVAMVRFYETSWLLHHHAAVRSSYNRGGLLVLSQAVRFLNDSHRIYSMKVDYVFCYFRPQNKFPNHVFGGTARNIKDPTICSLDDFAYLLYDSDPDSAKALPPSWQMDASVETDLLDLHNFYDNVSGGLALQALQLQPNNTDLTQLKNIYRQIGLKRERYLFTLRHRGKTCALIVVNAADLGLNMSDLTNSIKFFVVDGKYLTREIFQSAIESIVHLTGLPQFPVMVFPKQAAIQLGIDFEKTYCMWTYNVHRNGSYIIKYLKRLLKFIHP